MSKKTNHRITLLNSDSGSILFLVGISLIFYIFISVVLKGFYENYIINILLLSIAILIIIFGIIIVYKNRDTQIYSKGPEPTIELRSSLEKAMESAWKDHHHARDQTWKGLQMEALLAIALIGIDIQSINNSFSKLLLIGSGLLILLSISGIMITLHHRELEIRKFRHIMHCEDALGVRPYIDLVKLPTPIYIWDIFAFWKSNTVLFIMRMHFTILIFALWFFILRVVP